MFFYFDGFKLNQFLYLIFQAFINTAKEIYEKIQEGVFDINNEVYTYKYYWLIFRILITTWSHNFIYFLNY